MRWAILAVLCGCGRIAFDPIDDASTATPTHHLYVLDALGIEILDLDDNGSPSLAAASPQPLGDVVLDLRADTLGHTLYVSTFNSSGQTGTIHAFSIARETGSLTEIGAYPVLGFPQVVALHPSGRWLYVSDWSNASPNVFGYAIAADGTLTEMAGSPFVHAGNASSYIGVHPSGDWLYASSDDHFVYGFAVSQIDGSLTAVPAIRWASSDFGPYCVLLEPSGRFGWVAPDNAGGVPGFTIDQATGTLTTTPGSKFGAHGNTTMDATLDRTGTLAFFANQGDGSFGITAYAIDSNGALVDLPGSPIATAPTFTVLTVAASPDSDDVYFGASAPAPTIVHDRATAAGIAHVDDYIVQADPGRLTVVVSQ